MKNLSEAYLENKTVIVRVDFNVSMDDNQNITDDSRILAACSTINLLIGKGAKIILMSHLGRPKNGAENTFSLKHIVPRLSKLLGIKVAFAENCIGEIAESAANQLATGGVLLLENLRFHSEEKMGNVEFAKKLADLADVYVNDAFGTSHRTHASTSVIARFFPNDKYLGLLLKKEIETLELTLNSPKKPFTAIIGGAKITGKIEAITALLNKVDNLIIGGGMAYTFVKARGGYVGNSMLEEDKVVLAKQLISLAKKKNVNLCLPTDSVNAKAFNNSADTNVCDILNIPKGFMGLDIGEKSIAHFSEIIKHSKTILWNGPMGVFEMSNFANGTRQIANAICKATKRGAYSLVGGGDSVSAINKFSLGKKVSYVSTGGGSMLEYLKGKGLPGIEAILS